MVTQLNRTATGHIDPNQQWQVRCVDGTEVFIKMGGGSNSFAHKHILAPSSKAGVNDDTKMLRRIWHRVDKHGTHADNPDKVPKAAGAGIMSREDKYGSTLLTTTRRGNPKSKSDVKNSTICLSLLDLDTVLVDLATALQAWDRVSAKVAVTFTRPCVKTVDLAGHVTGPVATMNVEALRLVNGYEITHLVA